MTRIQAREASQPAVSPARSFGVRVTRDGVLVTHIFPVSESLAKWWSSIIPRVTRAGRYQQVEIEVFE